MSVGTSILIGAGVGAIGSVGGALIQGGAARSAADAQLQGQKDAIEAQKQQAARAEAFLREQAAQSRADLQPFRDSQLNAINQLQGLADPNSATAQAQRAQATQAIQRQLAAQGLLRSSKQGSQLSEVELGLALQRNQILSGLAGTGAGQAYAGVSSNLGTNLADVAGGLGNQLGSSFQNIGTINANLAQNTGNAITGALSGVNNAIQGGIGQYLNFDLQRKLLNSFGAGGAGTPGGFTGGTSPYFGTVA